MIFQKCYLINHIYSAKIRAICCKKQVIAAWCNRGGNLLCGIGDLCGKTFFPVTKAQPRKFQLVKNRKKPMTFRKKR